MLTEKTHSNAVSSFIIIKLSERYSDLGKPITTKTQNKKKLPNTIPNKLLTTKDGATPQKIPQLTKTMQLPNTLQEHT